MRDDARMEIGELPEPVGASSAVSCQLSAVGGLAAGSDSPPLNAGNVESVGAVYIAGSRASQDASSDSRQLTAERPSYRELPSRRKSRSGLSLVEVIVSIAILLMMSVSVGAVFGSGIELRTILEDRDVATRAARAALSTIRRELQLAYLTDQNQSPEFYQTVFVGLDGSTDTLYFATRAHQRLYRDTRESDQSEVTLWTESSRDGSRGYTLYHRESARVDGEPGLGGTVYPLAMNVRSFELRFLDGVTDEWQPEWDSRSPDFANRLPRAVQIGLVLIGVDPQDSSRTVDIPFFTTVMLQYADPLPRQGMSLATPAGGGSQPTVPTAPLRGGRGPGATVPGGNTSALGGGRR